MVVTRSRSPRWSAYSSASVAPSGPMPAEVPSQATASGVRQPADLDAGQAAARAGPPRGAAGQVLVRGDRDQRVAALAEQAVGQVEQPRQRLARWLLGLAAISSSQSSSMQQPPARLVVVAAAEGHAHQVAGSPNSRSGSSTQSTWHHDRHCWASARSAVVLPVPGAPCSSSSRPSRSVRGRAPSGARAAGRRGRRSCAGSAPTARR